MIKHPYFESHCNITATTVPHISMKDIDTYPVLVPPRDLQKRYAVLVQQTDKSKFEAKQALEYITAAQRALMRQHLGN